MKNLRNLREKRGLLQKDVAANLGIDRTTYVKYERGQSEPNFETLKKLASYFDVPVEFILEIGIFKNWDLVMEYKKPIFEYLKPILDKIVPNFFTDEIVDKLSETDIMELLNSIIEKIDFTSNGKDYDINILFKNFSDEISKKIVPTEEINYNKITEKEEGMLQKFRELDPGDQKYIEGLIDRFHESKDAVVVTEEKGKAE